MLALYLFSQISLWDLQVLPDLSAVLEQRQVAILDPNQLREGGNKENDEKRVKRLINQDV